MRVTQVYRVINWYKDNQNSRTSDISSAYGRNATNIINSNGNTKTVKNNNANRKELIMTEIIIIILITMTEIMIIKINII